MLNSHISQSASEAHAPKTSAIPKTLSNLLRKLQDQWVMNGKRGNAALILSPEVVVIQTVQAAIGPDIRDLVRAGEFLELDYCLANPSEDLPQRIVAFPLAAFGLASVWCQLLWSCEQQVRALPEDQRPCNIHGLDSLRDLVLLDTPAYPGLVTEQAAREQIFPGGPYSTYLGSVVVCWNNAMIRSICPFCAGTFKPSWGLWAFLDADAGGALCSECWRKGSQIAPFDEG
jgi:hypothetical protein